MEASTTNIKTKYIDEALIEKLIRGQLANLNLKNVVHIQDIRLDKQSFEVTTKKHHYYFVSINRLSNDGNSTTCSAVLLDKSGAIINTLDIAGPDDENRFWACDYVEAISFKDYYPDGSLKLIALFNVTPPSNERFMLPIIMKLDFNKPSLKIDEELTGKLDDADVNTIQGVRSYLKKLEKKR